MATLEARASAKRQPTRKQQDRSRWVIHGVLLGGALLMVYPLAWMVLGSFKDDAQIFSDPGGLPDSLDPVNYLTGWTATTPSFTRFFVNSFVLCLGAVIGNVLACTLAAFPFARLEFPFRRTLFAIMLGTLMLPSHVLLIPQYVIFFDLGWIDTYLPLIVPKFLATDAFFIFLLVQFIRRIPRELDDAAAIDGCGVFRTFLHVIVPLLTPALVTTVIFTFIWTYNDFFSQLIYLTSPDNLTVPVGLRSFVDATGGAYGQMLAMSVLSLVPTFVVFLTFQRRLVEGISTTGLKG